MRIFTSVNEEISILETFLGIFFFFSHVHFRWCLIKLLLSENLLWKLHKAFQNKKIRKKNYKSMIFQVIWRKMKTTGFIQEMWSLFKGFFAGFMNRPNYCSGILKENVYLVPNACNLPELFAMFFVDRFLCVSRNRYLGSYLLKILCYKLHTHEAFLLYVHQDIFLGYLSLRIIFYKFHK